MNTRSVTSSLQTITLLSLFALAGHAASPAAVNFTPPTVNAKTVQVTETVYQSQGSDGPGSLKVGGTMIFRIKQPDKYWTVWQEADSKVPPEYYITDGVKAAMVKGKKVDSQARYLAQIPFPLVGLLNRFSESVSAVPAVRDGKNILLAERYPMPNNHQNRAEYWFDPATHLMLRESFFMSWKGKVFETMRTEFSQWILNAPIPDALFKTVPPAEGK